MRLLSQMHSSFRGVSGSLSARSSFSFYLLAPPVPLHLFLSPSLLPAFAELSALPLYTTRTNTDAALTLTLIRVHRLSLLFLRFPPRLQRGSDSCSFLAFTSSSLLPRFLFFIFTSSYSGAALFGLGRVSGPPRDAGSWWFFITLVTGVVTLFGTPSFGTWYMQAIR